MGNVAAQRIRASPAPLKLASLIYGPLNEKAPRSTFEVAIRVSLPVQAHCDPMPLKRPAMASTQPQRNERAANVVFHIWLHLVTGRFDSIRSALIR